MKFKLSTAPIWIASLCLSIACTTSTAAERMALVIGNDAYQHARHLNNPKNDATAVAMALKNLSFNVIVRTNATLEVMKTALRDFKQQIQKGGTALVFFAGHGVQIKGSNFMVPIDAEMAEEFEVPDETLSMERVLRALEEAGSSLNLLVLDCCRNDPYSRSWNGTRSVKSSGLGSITDMPPGMFIAYATSPGKVAEDGSGMTHSPYTTALLNELATRPHVPLETMFKNVGRYVVQTTHGAQEPWTNSKFYGDFAFASDTPIAPTRQQTYEQDDMIRPPPTPALSPTGIPIAIQVAGKPGFVISPFDPKGQAIDVRSFESGQKGRCPYTGKIFITP